MKRLISFVLLIPILLSLLGAPTVAAHPQPVAAGATLDLIIQTSGSAQALARQVRSLGGQVHFVLRNLPAIAASIPFDKFNEVYNLPGVTSLQKDLPVRLPEDQPDKVVIGQTARLRSFPVETTAVIRSLPLNISSSRSHIEPQGYANFMYTDADQIWEETGYGAGSVVAVLDTGVYPNSCIDHAVIGAPGFPQGYNATEDGLPATDIQNDPHGTWVSGVIAADCYLDFSANPDDVVYQAISAYLPWPPEYVPLLGQAPLAKIYPVKVFPIDADSSFSIVLQGLDHVLSLKRDGLLDIDVVNLSLGWSSLYEERDIFEDMVSLLNDAGILVVSAAGNDGPILNSVLTPASTSGSLAVGGLDYAPSSRIWSELIGLIFGLNWIEFDGDEFAGMGMVTRPSAETKVADFASRGPLSNGLLAPDLAALSNDPLVIDQFDELWFGLGGTSFGTPSVAGVAALLNAYLEQTLGQEDAVLSLRNALLKGASLEALGEKWRGVNDVGFGALDAVGALERIQSGDLNLQYPVEVGKLRANILGAPLRDHTETYQSQQITLQQLEKFDRIFAISPFTSKVTIEVYDMVIPDNSDRTAFLNYLQLHVQSAKRGTWHPVGWWLGSDHPEIARIEITDGPWLFDGEEGMYQPMEPGLMKVTLLGGVDNESPVSFKLRIIRENYRPMLRGKLVEGEITNGQEVLIPVTLPEGISQATFDLVFNRDWSKFPTSDIDMYIFDPEMNVASFDGVSLNAPERARVFDPVPGDWWVYLYGYELYKPDHYTLYLNTENYEGK